MFRRDRKLMPLAVFQIQGNQLDQSRGPFSALKSSQEVIDFRRLARQPLVLELQTNFVNSDKFIDGKFVQRFPV